MSAESSTTPYTAPLSHIEVTPGTCGGRPRIAGHRIRVQDVVIWTEQGQSADEIVADFPQLSLADVYAALAYYHDHRAPIDQDLREDEEFFQQITEKGGPGWFQRRMTKDADGGNPISS